MFLFPPPPFLLGTLSKDVFERRTSTGSEALSLFICLDANKLVSLGFFSLLKTIYPRFSTKPLPNDAKSPLPVGVRRSKTLLLKLPIICVFYSPPPSPPPRLFYIFFHPQIHRPPIDPTSTPHRPLIDPESTQNRPHIDPSSIPHQPYIDPISTLHRLLIDPTSTPHRPYIDHTSTPHRPYIDPTWEINNE